jgi:hypothetical protein
MQMEQAVGGFPTFVQKTTTADDTRVDVLESAISNGYPQSFPRDLGISEGRSIALNTVAYGAVWSKKKACKSKIL